MKINCKPTITSDEKAVAMLEKGEENFEGVFVWAPRLKK